MIGAVTLAALFLVAPLESAPDATPDAVAGAPDAAPRAAPSAAPSAAPRTTSNAVTGEPAPAVHATGQSGGPSVPRLFSQVVMVGGWRPRTAVMLTSLNYRHTYIRDPDSLLFDRAYVQAGLSVDLTPAFGRYGVYVEWLPMQILRMRVSYSAFGYHGNLGLSTYADDTTEWSEEARRQREEHEVALVHNLRATAELRMKVGPVVALSSWELNGFFFEVDAPFAVDQWYGRLMRRDDGIIFTRNVLAMEFAIDKERGERFRIGAYYSFRRTFETGISNQRAGLAITWEPARELFFLSRPLFLLLAGFHVEDRWVQGQPTVLFGGGGSFDFLRDG